MNRERWKNTWGQLKGNVEHYWGQLNDEIFRPLGGAQGGVYQRLRSVLGSKDKADASKESAALDGEPLPSTMPEPTRNLRAVHEQRSNGG